MFEKVSIAVVGALVGSLIGRLTVNPGWLGHMIFLSAGALVFSAIDWLRRAAFASSPGHARPKGGEQSKRS